MMFQLGCLAGAGGRNHTSGFAIAAVRGWSACSPDGRASNGMQPNVYQCRARSVSLSPEAATAVALVFCVALLEPQIIFPIKVHVINVQHFSVDKFQVIN